jgi:hypothetical protein
VQWSRGQQGTQPAPNNSGGSTSHLQRLTPFAPIAGNHPEPTPLLALPEAFLLSLPPIPTHSIPHPRLSPPSRPISPAPPSTLASLCRDVGVVVSLSHPVARPPVWSCKLRRHAPKSSRSCCCRCPAKPFPPRQPSLGPASPPAQPLLYAVHRTRFPLSATAKHLAPSRRGRLLFD